MRNGHKRRSPEKTKDASPGKSTGRSRPVVMLVEDDLWARQLAEISLGKRYDVIGISEGDDLVDLAEECEPDLIILDIALPGENGLDLCRRLRRRESVRDIPVLFLTADHGERAFQEGMAAGGDSFMTKPVAMRDLFDRIERLITAGRGQDGA